MYAIIIVVVLLSNMLIMSATTTLTITTKEDIKQSAKDFFESIGLSLSSAVNAFLVDAAQNKRVRIQIGMPSKNVMTAEDYEILASGERAKVE